MAKYTTQVRSICENIAGYTEEQGGTKVHEVIDKSFKKIFNFNFPIFDETYRETLEKKILLHYYFREIGAETVGLWKIWLETKMNEIMPYYNQLYESESLKFNPLEDADYIRTGHNDNSGITDGSFTNTNSMHTEVEGEVNNISRYSDTPQGALDDLESNTYLTNATIDNSDNSSTTDSSGSGGGTSHEGRSGKEDYWETIKGRLGNKNYARLIADYRRNMLNIDMMIIDELAELFMNIY